MHVQQNADTEWIDDPRPYDGDKQDAGLDLRTQQLRERHALLVKQQADINERLHTGGQVWGEHTDSYRTLLEERLRIFYMQYLPTGSAFPDTKRAVSHFGGNAAAINEALLLCTHLRPTASTFRRQMMTSATHRTASPQQFASALQTLSMRLRRHLRRSE